MKVILKKHQLSIRDRKLNGYYTLVWVGGVCSIHRTESNYLTSLAYVVAGILRGFLIYTGLIDIKKLLFN